MSKTFLRIAGAIMVISMIVSCSMISGLSHQQFDFKKDGREKKLVFHLPRGRQQENFRVGENDAKEQFYYLGDGSVFYVARHITWQTVNKHRIDGLGSKDKRQANSFSGKDNDGLYWKEIQFEDFRIGYAYVPASRLDRFNEVLNLVKIK
jgi:hypothetical protein